MTRRAFAVFGLLLMSTIIVTGLYLVSIRSTQNSNHFERKILSLSHLEKAVDLGQNSFYIAGVSSAGIYLGSEIHPVSILIINPQTAGIEPRVIKNINPDSLQSGRVITDSSNFYLADRINQTVFKGSLNDLRVEQTIRNSLAWDLCIPVSNNSLVVRLFRSNGWDYTLAKETLSPNSIAIDTKILERKTDGVFSNDGMLDYDCSAPNLVYIYFHQNQYVVVDTNLNVLFRAKTIDSADHPGLKTALIKSDNIFTLAQPKSVINQSSCCYQNQLFVHSMLRAANENLVSFKHSDVIDVYDLRKGTYQYSFYLPEFKGHKIKNFAIWGGYCAAVSGHYLLIYSLEMHQ